jgi:fructose-bisphosphate aldolase class 1
MPGLLLAGVGIGLASTPITTAATAAVPNRQAGMATAAHTIFRTVGLSFGVAVRGRNRHRTVTRRPRPRGHAGGITAVLDQQFGYARQILDAGLVPILEPEIDITSTEKVQAEELLKRGIAERLPSVPDGRQVMLKLSIPTNDDFYVELIEHPKVLRVVALSGGYSRHQAIKRLARNHGLIASFSRALTEGLQRQQSEEEFNRILAASIAAIYAASTTSRGGSVARL